jgi:hypothetical protein
MAQSRMPREREASTDSDKAYWVGPGVPRAIPAGRVLAHDRSRFWTWPLVERQRKERERPRMERDQLKFDF